MDIGDFETKPLIYLCLKVPFLRGTEEPFSSNKYSFFVANVVPESVILEGSQKRRFVVWTTNHRPQWILH